MSPNQFDDRTAQTSASSDMCIARSELFLSRSREAERQHPRRSLPTAMVLAPGLLPFLIVGEVYRNLYLTHHVLGTFLLSRKFESDAKVTERVQILVEAWVVFS